jgi:hypothetical protein
MFEARFSGRIARRGDGAHPARPAPAMHRRSRVHGLAESVWVHQHACVGDDPYTPLCVADRPFDRRLKTKFGSDVGKFLRVQVAPVQGEKAESREASCAEVDFWHTGVSPDLD